MYVFFDSLYAAKHYDNTHIRMQSRRSLVAVENEVAIKIITLLFPLVVWFDFKHIYRLYRNITAQTIYA